ncbi:MAG: hypothetical protein V7L20_07985 [Nostoc sp.]
MTIICHDDINLSPTTGNLSLYKLGTSKLVLSNTFIKADDGI